MSFFLDPRLEADTVMVGDLPLCRVRLMNNRHFPWLVLVPMREAVVEIFDLSPADQHTLLTETMQAAQALKMLTGAQKMNVAALGNVVPQLHMHVIARTEEDFAWPKPVWCADLSPAPYEQAQRESLINRLCGALWR
jgi:diadenosine tetraphosphate (Ap4A) HIT family hydrolase